MVPRLHLLCGQELPTRELRPFALTLLVLDA